MRHRLVRTLAVTFVLALASGAAGASVPLGAVPEPGTGPAPAASLAGGVDSWVAERLRPDEAVALFERALESPDTARFTTADFEPRRPLKPGQAVMLSAVLPGLAQIRNRQLRGYVMLGLEAGLWFAYQGLRSGGRDRQASAERMAGSAFSVDAFEANASGKLAPATIEQKAQELRAWKRDNRSEYLNALATDADLVYGWSDFSPAGEAGASAERDAFVKRRDDGNRLLQHANTILSGVLLNHVVSAFDAYRNARKFQRELPLGVRMKVDLQPFDHRGSVVFTRSLW
ncbi:MAG: hypothetical protein HZB25_00340 [Candidatus Eisenbacteria bacterium]|nr:hypothetical protein [Candidatus Eisenbacteria bacterium]